jgi:SAM-dependent methyltransferase
MNDNLLAERWDEEYRHGRYAEEPPLPFVGTILSTLQEHRDIWIGCGLYVGCGNGRNYLPLVDAGADVVGLDISNEAIKRLAERRPGRQLPLRLGDFRQFASDRQFSYLIAIQIFQHGQDADVAQYFERVATLLRPGGLFFLRVNSAATNVYHANTMIERNEFGGFTVCYEEGPKRGLAVHFYSDSELAHLTRDHFEPLMPPRLDVIQRTPPKTGVWAQWEGIWRRRPLPVVDANQGPLPSSVQDG